MSAIVSGVASLASTAIAAKNSKKQAENAQNLLEQQKAENKKWYNSRMSEDVTRKADVQALLTKQRDILNERYNSDRATNAVAGGSESALAKQKEAANASVADTMSNVAAEGEQQKRAIEQQYLQQDGNLTQQQIAGYENQSQQIALAGGQAASAGVQMGSSLIDALGDKSITIKKKQN